MSHRLIRDQIGLSRLETLLRCLAFDSPDRAAGGHTKAIDNQDLDGVIAAGLSTRLLPALVDRCRSGELSMAAGCEPDRILARLGALPASFAFRRTSQRARLAAAVQAWNASGIDPLLMSAAQDVWLDTTTWRVAEELGALVDKRQHHAAGAVLAEIGYRPIAALERAGYRLETRWSHPQTSGILVLAAKGSNPAIERLLPSRDLLAWRRRAKLGDATALVLPAPVDALHALLHHHSGQTSSNVAAVAPKELYELASMVRQLSGEDLLQFRSMAARDGALQEVVKAWLEAAVRCFGLQLPDGADPSWRSPMQAPHTGEGAFGLIDHPGGCRIALRLGTGWRARIRDLARSLRTASTTAQRDGCRP